MRLAWLRGLLKYKLHDYQHELYDIFDKANNRLTVVNASRRWGKTFVAIVYAIIFGMQNPNSEIKMTSKTQMGLKDSFLPIWNLITRDAPPGSAPKWSTKDHCYIFPNGTRFHIHGTDSKRYENLRGDKCDLAIIDEASFCSSLRYIVLSVLMPQTLTCDGKIILLSTPDPLGTKSGEEFKAFCGQAKAMGSYFTKDIYSNTSITHEQIEEYKALAGGEDSVEWQTEYLCKFVIDPDKAIVSEWQSDKMVLDDDFNPEADDEYFRFWKKMSCLDLGVKRDWTVGLTGYYNFENATLYIMNEFKVKNTTTPHIAAKLLACEKEVFGTHAIFRRICDSDNPQLVNDFVHLHRIGMSAVEKTSLEAMVNSMKIMVGCNQVKVHPRCDFLINTLEQGVWADNEQGRLRKDFGRTEDLGHMDALAALMYYIRSLPRNQNPVPQTHGASVANTLISNHTSDSHNRTQLNKMTQTPRKRNGTRRRTKK